MQDGLEIFDGGRISLGMFDVLKVTTAVKARHATSVSGKGKYG